MATIRFYTLHAMSSVDNDGALHAKLVFCRMQLGQACREASPGYG